MIIKARGKIVFSGHEHEHDNPDHPSKAAVLRVEMEELAKPRLDCPDCQAGKPGSHRKLHRDLIAAEKQNG